MRANKMTLMTIVWCFILVASILILFIPSKFLDTTCSLVHAGYVAWIVAALFGMAGSKWIGVATVGAGFLLMCFCLVRMRKLVDVKQKIEFINAKNKDFKHE
jgi:hypothetical protein